MFPCYGLAVGMTLLLFTTQAPDPLAEELSQQGHHVFEALAISEILALAYAHPSATVIIKAEISPERALAVQQHSPTMHLKADATMKDVLWELNLKGVKVQ